MLALGEVSPRACNGYASHGVCRHGLCVAWGMRAWGVRARGVRGTLQVNEPIADGTIRSGDPQAPSASTQSSVRPHSERAAVGATLNSCFSAVSGCSISGPIRVGAPPLPGRQSPPS